MGCALYLKFKEILPEEDKQNLRIPKILNEKYFSSPI
jgi:hypothetical protein